MQLVLKRLLPKKRSQEESVTLADDGLLGGFGCNENVQLLQHFLQVVFCWLGLPGEKKKNTSLFKNP